MVPRTGKHLARALLALALPFAIHAQSAPGFVYENDTEFHTQADLNNDGAPDLVVLDKATGRIRIAEGDGSGALDWRTNSVRSGLAPATGLTAGPLLDPAYDQLAVAATLGNRIQIIDTPADTRLSEPLRVPDTSVGPTTVTALNVKGKPGGYDADFFDLAYHATLEDPADPNILHFFRNNGSGLPFPGGPEGNSSNQTPRHPNRIELETGKPPFYGVLADDGTSSTFRLLDPDDGLAKIIDTLPGLPAGVAYVYADFDNDDEAEFVFYLPGSATLYESEWTGSGLSPLSSFTDSAAIAELRVIDSAGQPELLIIRDGRGSADRVSYSGNGNFVLEESFAAASGQPIRGAVSAQDKLHLLDGSGTSTSLRTFTFDGSSHNLSETQDLPRLGNASSGSTVLVFDAAPLQDPDAQLLARYHAGPWTSAFQLKGEGAAVDSERFRGTSQGLGDPQTETIASLPAGAGGGLVNQVAPDNSIFFRDEALGEIISQLAVTPPSGTYDRALQPTFELTGDAEIYYRTSTRVTPWMPISSSPPIILDDTTLYAVAVDADGRFSNIVKADYVITGDSSTRDSNGDGLPDFAAVANGLDPLADSIDQDGDGFTNFQEVIAGTDPTDDQSKPARNSVAFEYPNSFDLIAAPAVPDPANPTTLLRPPNTPGIGMEVHRPSGALRDSGSTSLDASLGYPAARFPALDGLADDRFLVTATQPNFSVLDGANKPDYGREMTGLAKIPELSFSPFTYSGFGDNGGYGNLAAETADWRTAAQAYFNNLTRPEITRDPIGPVSTLELLLVETILGQRLFAEGFSDRSELTLTPFRPGEDPLAAIPVAEPLPDPVPNPDRDRKLSPSLLAERKKALSADSSPFYSVEGIIDTVRDELAAESTTNIQQLKKLAERLYTTSATTSGASLRQPLPALRQFIRSGSLTNTGYDDAPASNNFPAALLADAAQGVSEIAKAISPRPTETVTLYIEGGEASAACPTWKEVFYSAGSFDPDSPSFTGTEYALLDDQGDPYPIARAFPLTVGSVIQVTGYVLENAPCGDAALEVIPPPSLAFLRNASAADQNGNLIPDGIEERMPGVSLSPFSDTDGDGYSDLQEILDGSDPNDAANMPMDGGNPAPVAEVGPPRIKIVPAGPNSAAIEFDYPSEYVPYIEFQLYRSDDLNQAFSPTGQTPNHTGGGRHEQVITQDEDNEFFIFRMQLK